MNLTRLAARWERRQRERASLEQQERLEAPLKEPLELVSVREHVDLSCAAAEVWQLVVDPGNAALLDEDPGALIGRVEEITDLVPGSRIVARSLSTMHLSAGALEISAGTMGGDGSCRLTYEMSAEVHPDQAPAFRVDARRAARRMLARAAHALDGRSLAQEPAPLARQPDSRHEAREVVLVVAHAEVERSAPAGRVWDFVLAASNDRLDSFDPEAISFGLPGTPAGGVGELRCVIVHSVAGALVAVVQEVTGIDHGRSFVTRHRSLTHAARTTTVVEALGNGARLRTRLELEVHPDEADSAQRRYTAGAVHHLEAVRRRLEASG